MTITVRAASLAVVLLVIGGCSSASSSGTATAPAPAASSTAVTTSASAAPGAYRRPGEASQAAFAAAFAQQWPQLTQGRTAKGIGNDLDNFCGDLSRGEPLADASTRMGARIATSAATPDAATIAAVAQLATTFCR